MGARIEREYSYAYAAVSPHDGALVSLVLPAVNAELMSLFLAAVAPRYVRPLVLVVLDGAGWHRAKDLIIPANMRLAALPAYSPELNPAEHLWQEIREKWLGNQLFFHQQAVERQVEKSLAALEGDPQRVASLAGFHWIQKIPLTAT